jgi:hypothetical protein
MPAWNNKRSMFSWKNFGFLQGIVPTVRNISRKYWLNHRVWINHPDLIYFNNDRWPEWADRPLTFNESLCFASAVGLTGGIVKIGDKMVDMTGTEVDVIRRLIPIYKASARPVDLFEKETPEIWDLKVETDFDAWDVVGVFNWGESWQGREHISEEERSMEVELSDLGLDPNGKYLAFDFWNEELLGVFQGRIILELAPRTVRVLAVRPLPGHPRFVSYNRHITQGAIDIKNMGWDPEKKVLSGEQEAVPGYEYHLYFYCPAGFRLTSANAESAVVNTRQDGDLIRMDLVSGISFVRWRLSFSE